MHKKTGRVILVESRNNYNLTKQIITRNLKFDECLKDPDIRKGIKNDQDCIVQFGNAYFNFMQIVFNKKEIVKYISGKDKAVNLKSFSLDFYRGRGRLKDFPWETVRKLFTDFQEVTDFEVFDTTNRRSMLGDRMRQLEISWKNLISLNLQKRRNKFFKCHIPNDPKDPTRKLYRE
ncbi:uncharacterized protein LOC122501289 [Leptopilina heterotoma]|uniref:uncharacterized protein LOC122501289 n=1 Tax=Leptopilina heterotoma TaxID=63436 RepID=UPI001CA8FE51|nr:uncharacterized protein LOC122501289 [Leptopilina heterotoma]